MEKSGEKWGMLIGEYRNTVDSKKRVALPKKFRTHLSDSFILTRGYEGCLLLVSKASWNSLISTSIEGPFTQGAVRDTTRFLLAGAFEIDLDAQGRFVIPQSLAGYAQIKNEACFLGLGKWIEIWDLELWEKRLEYLGSKGSEIAERLSKSQI